MPRQAWARFNSPYFPMRHHRETKSGTSRLSAALDKQVKVGIFGFAEVVADATDFDTVNQFFLA